MQGQHFALKTALHIIKVLKSRENLFFLGSCSKNHNVSTHYKIVFRYYYE